MPEPPPTTALRPYTPLEVLARLGPLIALLAGAILLAAAEFSTLYEVRALDAVLDRSTGGERHGYALLVVAVALVPLAWSAVMRRSRPAAIASVVLAIAATGVVALVDAPAVGDAGVYEHSYELAAAGAGAGLRLEVAGVVLTLAGAVWAIAAAIAAHRRRRAARLRSGRLDVAAGDPAAAGVPASYRSTG